jgi:TRAP-type transport system periplasmic protein
MEQKATSAVIGAGLTRRQALAAVGAGAALPLFAIGRAHAAEFAYKFGNDNPASHPINVRMGEAAERIRKESNGRLDIQLFPNSQLGGDSDMLTQLRAGAIEIVCMPDNVLATLTLVASIDGIAFAFPDYATVWKAMDGDLGGFVRKAIEKVGISVLPKMWDNGFRQITSSTHPINTPEDLKGFKIRVPVAPLWVSTFKAFGASPISLNSSEMYSALQTKIADGEENALPVLWVQKLYEVQKYCSLTSHMWAGYWSLVNKAAWSKLPPDLQQIAAKNIEQATLEERDDLVKLNAELEGKLKAKGMVFNSVDRSRFRAALVKAGFYADWKKRFGDPAWDLLEKYCGKLG